MLLACVLVIVFLFLQLFNLGMTLKQCLSFQIFFLLCSCLRRPECFLESDLYDITNLLISDTLLPCKQCHSLFFCISSTLNTQSTLAAGWRLWKSVWQVFGTLISLPLIPPWDITRSPSFEWVQACWSRGSMVEWGRSQSNFLNRFTCLENWARSRVGADVDMT